eukprot:g31982.t1
MCGNGALKLYWCNSSQGLTIYSTISQQRNRYGTRISRQCTSRLADALNHFFPLGATNAFRSVRFAPHASREESRWDETFLLHRAPNKFSLLVLEEAAKDCHRQGRDSIVTLITSLAYTSVILRIFCASTTTCWNTLELLEGRNLGICNITVT